MSALKFLGIFFLALGIVKSVQVAILYAKERFLTMRKR